MNKDRLDQVYAFQLVAAANQFKKYAHEQLLKAGIKISSDQWVVLKRVAEHEGVKQKELADLAYKDPASITRILDILQRKGWVERRPSTDDRRAYGIYTTQAGAQLVEQALPVAKAIRAKGLEGIDPKEAEKLIHLLKQIRGNLTH
ncbi:MAG: MarR family transcriptional regulator [Bacteroidota bacterium]